MEHFNHLWENNEMFRWCIDKILHISGVFIAGFPRIMLLIVGAVSDADSQKEVELNKIEAQKRIEQYDNAPVAARTILPVGTLSIVMIILVGLWFVAMNVKENEMTNQDDNQEMD